MYSIFTVTTSSSVSPSVHNVGVKSVSVVFTIVPLIVNEGSLGSSCPSVTSIPPNPFPLTSIVPSNVTFAPFALRPTLPPVSVMLLNVTSVCQAKIT